MLRLQSWVDKNRNLAYEKPQMELIKMVDSVLEDHIIDDSEKKLMIAACEEFLTDARDNSSLIYELNGIIEGVVCDGEVNEQEILRLKRSIKKSIEEINYLLYAMPKFVENGRSRMIGGKLKCRDCS